jgi:molybdopterin-binding protein
MRIEIDCGFTLLGVLTINLAQELGLSVGQELFASFKAAATHTVRRHD